MTVTSSYDTMDLPVYCNLHASGDGCCDWQTDPPGDCSDRPGSNATITITYWPPGRCCHSDGSCTVTSSQDCSATGGTWTLGQTCGAGACSSGSCCIPATGDCSVTNETTCDGRCGAWSAGGVCSPNPCSVAPMGACCYDSGLCVLDTQVHCDCVGGTRFHSGATCEPNPCDQPSPIIYVDQSVTGTHDGNFWSTAWPDLQSALNAVPTGASRRIWVAQGTYKPSSPSAPTMRYATFQLPNNVALYGGFEGAGSTRYPGGETALCQRDPSANRTILSGDLNGDDDPNFVNYSDNVYRVLTAMDVSSLSTNRTLILDGFVITGGSATGASPLDCAGGMAIYQGGMIRNCVFVGNLATNSGAAVYCGYSAVSFVNCLFGNNRCLPSGSGVGGAIRLSANVDYSGLTVTNCTFVGNTAPVRGGAIAADLSGDPSGIPVSISNSIFWYNTAASSPQISTGAGIAVSVTYSDVQGGFGGSGNINTYPAPLDPNGPDGRVGSLDDNWRLSPTSPCIDAGNNSADIDVTTPGVQPIPRTDLDLHARQMDDPNSTDAAGQSCPVVDMGAYEFRRLCEAGQCVRGDGNADGLVNGLDIQPLVNCILGSSPNCACPCYDTNLDGLVTVYPDVFCFVNVLLGVPACVVSCEQTGLSLAQDCNANCIPDVEDIARDTSHDCNHNFTPDECDIDPNDPDGNELVSSDLNENGIPDECEADYNANAVPDDKDIADCDPYDPNQVWCRDVNANGIPDGCEVDCNKNGIPDSWEIAQNLVDDCDANGVPDECERDCNDNGVPDACDIANQTSEDCNGNLVPDECDLLFAPPRGSLDCNDNGIPDECDIANCGDPNDPNQLWCQDCNANGVPDGCDIAANVSLDENENGVPDECEGGQRGVSGGEIEDPQELMEAWAEYFDWLAGQQWLAGSELSGSERFELMAEKMQELGLPVRNWTMPARGAGG
ncbi:MAG TPA: hypothetical protein VMV94_09345 [Phycisphaerae bacterium]|nr:hypothetical protein [Phycisphaerae bacterium]